VQDDHPRANLLYGDQESIVMRQICPETIVAQQICFEGIVNEQSDAGSGFSLARRRGDRSSSAPFL
jgi:hypothetical protein